MAKLALGLDVGISSVGWSVVNLENGSLVDCGVRLFEEGSAAENLVRRTRRGSRRLKSRRQNRLVDARTILMKYGLICDLKFKLLDNPYALRAKGLKEVLTNEELATAILHLVKRRGSSLETVEEDEKKQNEDEKVKNILLENEKLVHSGKFPCEIQLDRMQSQKHIRGEMNIFKTKHYVNELNQILSNQKLDSNLTKELIVLIQRRRQYYEGPGSEKSPTIYGRFIPQDDGSVLIIDLIEKMRGKCSLFEDQPRAPKSAPSTELFNFLNDLNNITIHLDEDNTLKINQLQKQEIIEKYIINGKHNITPKQLAGYLEVDLESLTGFRIDKDEEPKISGFEGYKKLVNSNKESPNLDKLNNFVLLDKIVEVLTKTKGIEERVIELNKLPELIGMDQEITNLSKISGLNQYHALSFKAIYELNEELKQTNDNQMQIISRKGYLKLKTEKYKGLKNIPADHEAILSPVAKKSQQESIKIVNRVRSLYGEMDKVVIEMPRDKNSQEEKNRIKLDQKNYEVLNRRVIEYAQTDQINSKTKMKVRLYMDQDGKCLYTGQALELNRILTDPNAYEIDHIIPISVSFDDSYQNKVLVINQANQVKTNMTPVAVFNQGLFKGWSYETYYTYVLNLRKTNKISVKKFLYLVFDKDINKFETLKEFINRNLVDTRYASRVLLNTLQKYFAANEINTHVSTIKGAVTSAFRKQLDLTKNREESHYHHAVDATIIALLSKQRNFDAVFSNVQIKDDLITFENFKYDYSDPELFYEQSLMKLLSEVKNIQATKISYKVDRKPNRQISDETIYSTRLVDNEEKVVKKFKDIYDQKFTELALIILGESKSRTVDDLLIYQHDRKSFEKLEAVVQTYIADVGPIDKENPFYWYKVTQGNGSITKYTKKGVEGAPLISIKYYDGNLGNHIDVSKSYDRNQHELKLKRVVLLQISSFRTDIYRNKQGLYKMITIRRKDVKFDSTKKIYFISPEVYSVKRIEKGVDDTFGFCFTLNRNDMIEIKKVKEMNSEKYRFVVTNDENANIIEVKPLNYYEKKQMRLAVGKSIESIRKYNTDVLGNVYEVKNEVLTFEILSNKI